MYDVVLLFDEYSGVNRAVEIVYRDSYSYVYD
jgi:hypothetical protein